MLGITRSVAASPDRIAPQALQPMLTKIRNNAMALRDPHTADGDHLDQGLAIQRVDGRSVTLGSIAGRAATVTTPVYWLGFVTRRTKNIAHLVEFGTAPHYQPHRKIMHPGAVAKPFFTNGFASTRDAVIGECARLFQAAIAGFGVGGKG